MILKPSFRHNFFIITIIKFLIIAIMVTNNRNSVVCSSCSPSSSIIHSSSSIENLPKDVKTKDGISQCTNQASLGLSESTQFLSVIKTINDFRCEELDFCDDRLGFEAILYLHRQLDEDANGDVDISESDEFLRDELKYENCAERQKAFHGNDKHISVDELWRSWKVSAVHNWTVDQTIEWLVDVVDLPKYKEKFQSNGIDGTALPRLAANTQIYATLSINNPIHKQKLALKAMDVVLFGLPKTHSLTKDLIMCALLMFAIGVGWYAFYQHKYSQQHIRKMMKDMEVLSTAEKQLEYLQNELNKTKKEQENASKEKESLEKKLNEQMIMTSSLNGSESLLSYISNLGNDDSKNSSEDQKRINELEKELLFTKSELKRIKLAYESSYWTPPRELQLSLQLTYELETKNYNLKKKAAEIQLQAAREGCDKLKRKRTTLLGQFRVAHGSSMDFVENKILQARFLLSELTNEMQERIKRWKQIEMLCQFDIIDNPGLISLEHALYGTSFSSSSRALIRKGSDSTMIDDETSSLKSISSQALMTNLIPNVGSSHSIQNPSRKISLQQPIAPTIEEDDGISFAVNDDVIKLSNNSKTISQNNIMPNNIDILSHRPKLKMLHRGSSDGVEKSFDEFLNRQTNLLKQTKKEESTEELFLSSSSSSSNELSNGGINSAGGEGGNISDKNENPQSQKNKRKSFFSGIKKRKSKSNLEKLT